MSLKFVAARRRGAMVRSLLLQGSIALLLPVMLGATVSFAAEPATAAAATAADNNRSGNADAGRDATLLEGNGVEVGVADVLAEVARVPPPARDELLRNPNSIAQVASNIYVRRALAAEAIRDGLAKDPTIQAQLQIAHDRVLSDARFARIDEKTRPADSMLEQYAKTTYQADPKRFAMPDEVHARHILIKGTGDASRAKAEQLLTGLKKNGGADFEAVARQESNDPGSAPNGGDLGFFSRGRMVKSFEDAAFELAKPGELSDLVESPFGFHIIQLVERRSAGTRPFAEVEGALHAEAAQKLAAEARTAKAKALLADAKFNRGAIEALSAGESRESSPVSASAPAQPSPAQPEKKANAAP